MSGVAAPSFHECLQRADSGAELVAFVRRHVSGLTFTDDIAAPQDEPEPHEVPTARLSERGWVELTNAADASALAIAIDELQRAQIAPVWMYLANEPWELGERLRARVSRILGREYRLLADVWAWWIPPGARGWLPHRGIDAWLLERDVPEILNVWVALVDIGVEKAAMHFVALDHDPSYPERLACIDVPDGAAEVASVCSGAALVWNANILHWGGACSATARGPRLSCSFSLVREDALGASTIPTVDVAALDLGARVDLLAAQIVTYGAGQVEITPEVMAWARANYTFRAVLQRRRV